MIPRSETPWISLFVGALFLGLPLASFGQGFDFSNPPSWDTTATPEAGAQWIEQAVKALRSKVSSAQVTLLETATAEVPGLREAIQSEAQALEKHLRALGEEGELLQSLPRIQQRLKDAEARLETLENKGLEVAGPYPLERLDTNQEALDERRAKGLSLKRESEDLVRSSEALAQTITRARKEVEDKEKQRSLSKDPTRLPTLNRQLEAARAELRALEHERRILDQRLSLIARDQKVLEQETKVLEFERRWLEESLDLSGEAYERTTLGIEKQRQDLLRALETLKLEATPKERRWMQYRERLDGVAEPSPEASEELETRFQEFQINQRLQRIHEEIRRVLEERKSLWERRYQLLRQVDSGPPPPAVEEELLRSRDGLEQELELSQHRTKENQRWIQDLEARIQDPGSTKVRRFLNERLESIRRLQRTRSRYETEIASSQQLIERVVKKIREEKARESRLVRFLLKVRDQLLALFQTLGPQVRTALQILLMVLIWIPLTWFFADRADGAATRLYRPQTGMIARKVVSYGSYLALFVVILNTLGFGLGPLLGAAGVTGVALGFASQTSVSNIISGLFLIAEQPFQVGEIIQLDSIVGTVLSVDLLSVKLRLFDNKFVRIPNETILKSNVINISRHPLRRVELDVSVSYKEKLDQVEKILLSAAKDAPKVMESPEPAVHFTSFGDHGIHMRLCAWVITGDFMAVKNGLFKDIKLRFDEAGVEIPYPRSVLYAGVDSLPIQVQVRGASALGEGASEAEKEAKVQES